MKPKAISKPNGRLHPAYGDDDARWTAVISRDTAADGAFVYAVATTGIYCRPTCASRRPKRSNVAFYANGAQAGAAGFRPCKRCRPDSADALALNEQRIARACRLIEQGDTPGHFASLAEAVGMSPYHFHRQFKAATGVTPKAYWLAHANAQLRKSLPGASNVTHAVLEAGFNSARQFYGGAGEALGMTPRAYRAGGKNAVIRFAAGRCSLGVVLVAATDKGVCAILLGDDADTLLRDLRDRFPKAELIGGDAAFEATIARVIAYVDGKNARFALPLDLQGTAFQHRVWQALRDIRRGETASYGEIAARIGKPDAVRAVAGACAANPAAIVIPCHRVVRTDGTLSGYRWGIERKRALLEREASTRYPSRTREKKASPRK